MVISVSGKLAKRSLGGVVAAAKFGKGRFIVGETQNVRLILEYSTHCTPGAIAHYSRAQHSTIDIKSKERLVNTAKDSKDSHHSQRHRETKWIFEAEAGGETNGNAEGNVLSMGTSRSSLRFSPNRSQLSSSMLSKPILSVSLLRNEDYKMRASTKIVAARSIIFSFSD
ncbi:hypothetical protein WN51_10220 [Melipona quadrifasciata]|uniref:Uncharacterized protein n=1 Tax=Melipona quadrifasciata TaxID=166423 RepID=A0A0M9A4L2_9HYME|nr:hypothetical protein WN51_10220 [Melipona quadrifasciata]